LEVRQLDSADKNKIRTEVNIRSEVRAGMLNAGRDIILSELRRRIESLERGGRKQSVLPFGVSAIDQRLPDGGLALGAIHEAVSAKPDLPHAAATILFAAGVLARLRGPVLWCLTRLDLFAPGLASTGLHPDRVIYAEAGDENTALAIAEEALRQRGLAGVVLETTRLALTPSRRLQHAAEASGVIGLVLRRWPRVSKAPSEANVAATRWRVAALPSSPLGGTPGVGRPRWQIELMRCRGGQAPYEWVVEACDGAGRLRLVSDVADRSAPPEARRAAG
jgi:protein ImuA